MANHALPTTTSLYTDVLTNLKDRIDDSLKMLDSVNTSPTNVPTNTIRWNSTTTLWEKYNGSSWISLAASYAIKVLKSTNLVGGDGTTLLGSIPYQSNTDTTTLLAPNTTTTRKFLRQTGTGTNGAAPVWDTILASDIPTLNQNTTGSSGSCTGNSATATTANSLNASNSYTGGYFTANGGALRTQNCGNIPTNGVVYFGNAESFIFKSGGTWYFNNQQGFNNVLGTDGNIVTENGGNWNINAATATKLTNSSGDWLSSGAIANVVGMLSWKNYGNGHVIFDASNGTSPNGVAVNNTNPTTPWAPTYPTLMGWNGGQTYGVRVDSARVADSATTAANADKLIGKNWNWSGQGGQPTWLWGGSDGTNMYVYSPANFSVNYANIAGYANGISDGIVGLGGRHRAWVCANGITGGIYASGNVSSITDNGVGDFTVNFTGAMPHDAYAVCGSASGVITQSRNATIAAPSAAGAPYLKSTMQCRLFFGSNGTNDAAIFNAAFIC